MWFFSVLCGLVVQSCRTLCDPMDCSPPGFSVYQISQANLLEWVAISFSRGSITPRDWTWVFCIACRFFTGWSTRETLLYIITLNLFIYIECFPFLVFGVKFIWHKTCYGILLKFSFFFNLAEQKYNSMK